MQIGSKTFDESHTHIMGILNLTPDSFSDGGSYLTVEAALLRAAEMEKEGASILDIGGESTRPGYIPITESEEIERICPVIEAIHKRMDLPISVDTYKPAVAREAVAAGAVMINDIWGLMKDPDMGKLISQEKLCCCLMHNRSETDYKDFLADYLEDVNRIIENASEAKIEPQRIILDPGIGFAKNTEQNLIVLKHLDALKEKGYPILIGASRKSVIGNVLDLPIHERLEGTLAITALSVLKGAMFVRVHDVKENARVIKMLEAIKASL